MARVLVVEDEPTDRVILGRIVEGAGHDVHLVLGGEDALNVYMGWNIDVIVTDLQMPGIDGLELIVALQALFPDVAIIVVSGRGPELLAAAKDKGALVAFSKPVNPQELLDAIAHAAPGRPSRSPPSGEEGNGGDRLLPMDIPQKVRALKVWLSDRMGAEVDTPFSDFKINTYGFRILVRDLRPPPVLWVSLEAFEDHAVEKIWNDLERQQVPGMLLTDPAQHLLYTTTGEVKRYDPLG